MRFFAGIGVVVVAMLVAMPCGLIATAAEVELKVVTNDERPKVSPELLGVLDGTRYEVVVQGTVRCSYWWVKTLELKTPFKPTANIKYPFSNGQLLGVMVVTGDEPFQDFRGQDVQPGTYTLRYGQQPVDGNHIGTSELYDFLLALPADRDRDPALLKSVDKLHQQSAATAGSNHPAIYALLPANAQAEGAQLQHLADKEHWTLQIAAKAADGAAVPVRMVVLGQSEG
jgi:hypothetical protein